MILPILIKPHKTLLLKSQSLARTEIKSTKIQTLIDDMIKTMKKADGIGLAAVQVGILLRLTIIDVGNGPFTVINPKYINKSFRKIPFEEGCLSIPGVYGQVVRPETVRITFLDQQGRRHFLKTGGLLARVLQHEIDHMNGMLFTSKVISYTEKQQIIPKYPHVTNPHL
jgi:peptide deformylase